MRKFKLIKTYPGSPQLGFVVAVIGWSIEFYADNPEFWEEVVEKNYEILSVIIPNYNQICKKEGDYFVAKRGGISPFILGTHIDYKIHSVKRLSDGEV